MPDTEPFAPPFLFGYTSAMDDYDVIIIGEAVDVTGHLGGFNFQWAWASGHACGTVV